MSNSTLPALSLSALKALAATLNAVPTGDKRSKQSWVAAIETAQSAETIDLNEPMYDPKPEAAHIMGDEWITPETVSDVEMEQIAHTADKSALTQNPTLSAEAIEPATAVEKVLYSKSIVDSPIPALEPNTQALEQMPPQYRGASTVALIVIFVVGLALIVIKTGFASIAWVITALVPLALDGWRYLVPAPLQQEPIDYSALPVG